MSRSYFISDVHLGAAFCDRKALEQRFVALLDRIREERADAVYLLGDIFDFWYEYRYDVPADTLGFSQPCSSGSVQRLASQMGFRSGLCLGRSFQKDEE